MYAVNASTGAQVIVKNLNMAGATQPSAAELNQFGNEASLDAALPAAVAAKDKPYLTLNDKVYAVRIATASVAP